jgi:CHASE3 domain sensor protein
MKSLLIYYIISFTISSSCLANTDEVQNNTQQLTIKINNALQLSSGIETTTVDAYNQQTEFIAYGKAVNLHPLLALRTRYLQTIAESNRALAKFKHAEQTINRQQDLFKNGVSSKRNLQEHQAQWHIEKAQADASNFQAKAIIDEAILVWGQALTDWALNSKSDNLSDFISGQRKLLQITLPSNKHLTETIKTIVVDTTGNRNLAHKADYISATELTESITQGESYYFQSTDKKIKTGMNITAWIPENDKSETGVIIPKSALIWNMDQAFVYIKTDEETFHRRIITQYTASNNGYFVANTIEPGEKVVTKGAQMLLSEELRGQIPSEDND